MQDCVLPFQYIVWFVKTAVFLNRFTKRLLVLRQYANLKLLGVMRFIELPTSLFGGSDVAPFHVQRAAAIDAFCSEACWPVLGPQSKLGQEANVRYYRKFIVDKLNIEEDYGVSDEFIASAVARSAASSAILSRWPSAV